VATDGRVKGYCAVAGQYVDFPIETQLEIKKWWQSPEYRAKLSSAMKKRWQDPEYRAKQIATHRGKYLRRLQGGTIKKGVKRYGSER
jgi:hypothetical protein